MKKTEKEDEYKYYFYIFTISLIVVLILDFIWIGILNNNIYTHTFEKVQGERELIVRKGSASLAYILIPLSILLLVYRPWENIKDRSISELAMNGGLVGFFIYGIFNATNHALFIDYPTNVAIKDTLWGTFLYSVTTIIPQLIMT